jgi:hypothetical protein
VELGGAIELHAAFRKESRKSLPPVSAALQEIRESRGPSRGFLPRKTTPRDLYQATVIAKRLNTLMFDNSIGAFSGILHPLWNWGAEAANRPPPPPPHEVQRHRRGPTEEREESAAENEDPAENE